MNRGPRETPRTVTVAVTWAFQISEVVLAVSNFQERPSSAVCDSGCWKQLPPQIFTWPRRGVLCGILETSASLVQGARSSYLERRATGLRSSYLPCKQYASEWSRDGLDVITIPNLEEPFCIPEGHIGVAPLLFLVRISRAPSAKICMSIEERLRHSP